MDDLIQVEAILQNGDTVALPTGTLYSIFRVVHDSVSGESSFVFEGTAALTGAHQTMRMREYADSAGASPE